MAEKSIFEGNGMVLKYTDKWESLDGGTSIVAIYHNTTDDKFRLVARASNKQFVLNNWVKKDCQFTKLSDTLVNVHFSGVNYGINFSKNEEANDFLSSLENCVEILKLKDGLQGALSPKTVRHAVLQVPDDMPIPPPIAQPVRSASSRNLLADSVPFPSNSSTSSVPLEEKLAEKKSSLNSKKYLQRNLRASSERFQTISAKELTKKYQSLRLKKKDINMVSGGTSNSLNTIAINFEEESLQVMRNANRCVLNPETSSQIMSLGKIKEMLEMILILTKRPDSLGVLHQLFDSLSESIQRTPNHGRIDQNTVEAASGLAIELVKASLIKKILNSLLAVHNLAIQMKCILTYIANIDVDHVAILQLCATTKSFLGAANQLTSDVATLKHLDTLDIQKLSSTVPSADTEGSLWDEKILVEQLDQNKDEIKVGNLNQLILKLTSETSYDNKFLKTFIITYQSFTTPWLLFEKLKQRYQVPGVVPEKVRNLIQLRVTIVLKHWAETQIDDFDDTILLKLQEFLRYLSSHEGLKNVATALENYVVEKISERQLQTKLWFQEPEKVSVPDEGLCLPDLFIELPSQLIAEQLTLIDFEIFKNIEPTELLDQSWNKQKLKHRSPNVLAMINRSTNVSLWVGTMILSQENINFRVRMYEKMVDIAKHLEKLQNFNTLMGLVAGLNLSAIHRLKITKKKVMSAKLETFSKLEKVMDPEGSFTKYRKQISSYPPPSLPYLGVHLSDLTFIEEGNPNFIDGLINFKKRDMLVETIRQIQQYQSTSYNLEIVEPVFTFLCELPCMDEKELYNVSVALEKTKKK